MPLIRSGRVARHKFKRIADDAPVPDGRPVIVTAARFLAEPQAFARRQAPTGVVWPNNRPVAELAPYLDRLGLVALEFPSFRDGRAYSQARLLRERYGFDREIRATGQVLRDQFLFLVRAGFNAFEVSKKADVAAFTDSVRRYSVFYQPTGDGRTTALRARLERAVPRRAPAENLQTVH
jgi:uncharacterized protein (DUF934 family)